MPRAHVKDADPSQKSDCANQQEVYRVNSSQGFRLANDWKLSDSGHNCYRLALDWRVSSAPLLPDCKCIREEATMQQSEHERRTMRRFDMRLPAAVRLDDLATLNLQTETQNVSARGVFFYLDRLVEEGTRLEMTLTFPPHVTLTDSVRVRFTAKVVRVETPLPASRIGVAAVIEEYEFLRAGLRSEFVEAQETRN